MKRRLSLDAERMLCRYCYVLALFEQFYRADVHGSPLLDGAVDGTVESVLALAPDHAIDDLVALSWAFFDTQEPLLDRPAVLSPTFAGGSAVGGADADLIVDTCLIDVKVTVQNCQRRDAYQLIGYALLNWDGQHTINSVGFYLARVPKLIAWSLNELPSEMAEEPTSLEELQADLRGRLASA